MTQQRGILITVEGPDGAGKTSLCDYLMGQLEAIDRPAIRVREPGGTVLGERLRDIVKDAGVERTTLASVFVFLAARAELVERVIRPALEAGNVVIADRHIDSTVAYQGGALGAGVLRGWNLKATGGLLPDLTLLLDVPHGVALARLAQRGALDGVDAQAAAGAWFESVRQRYLSEARRGAAAGRTFPIINAARPAEDVALEAWAHVARSMAAAGLL